MRELILKYALKNALDFGKANPKAVLGKVLAERQELRKKAREILPVVEEVVEEVNRMSKEEIEQKIKEFSFIDVKKPKEQKLPELKNAEPGKVVMRFAPNPSGPLHLGHARAAVLNHHYSKQYQGRLVLRFEDTDPKRVMPEAYDMIREDLHWLGIEWHQEVIQSKRLEIYYAHAKELIKKGYAYVCTCTQEEFQKLKLQGIACEHREREVEENLEEFEKMFSEYGEGEAVLRFKSGLEHKDPALKEFPIMRISDTEHPLVKARVYPLMNFSVTIDDHLLGITHVLRGKDHLVNTKKQSLIYKAFGWNTPEFIHYGRLKISQLSLSTSKIKEGIARGEYSDWSDPRLGTLLALRKRGIMPQAIARAMLDVGIKQSDISFSWKNLYAYNREIVEPKANRYFFVAQPVVLLVEGAESFTAEIRLHPDFPERGLRKLELRARNGLTEVLISGEDYQKIKQGDFIRLISGFNIEIVEKGKELRGVFRGFGLEEAKQKKARFIHWLPAEGNIPARVLKPEGENSGYVERNILRERRDAIVQFERYGFCRAEEISEKEALFYFSHE